MGKIIKFKREGDSINMGGRVIRQHDLTAELYEELVRMAPSHADHFEVIDDDVKEKPDKVEKSKKAEA